MYAEGTMTREEFRRARREQVLQEQKNRWRRIFLFFVTLIVMFGMGVGFGTLLARAEEPASAYKYYTSIEIEKGDTLWEIAETYMDAEYYKNRIDYISEVMKINRMTDDHLTAGKTIIVPYYSTEAK